MSMVLEDGARVGVLGGGPAGSLFAFFLLTFARRIDLDLAVDIYEPRDFSRPGPAGCNMCGGVVSESLIQMLALEGINLPAAVVQRGIDSYVLHTDRASVKIDTPMQEKRIAAVHRGAGPRDVGELRWTGLDGYLIDLAQRLGARVESARVGDIGWDGEKPQVRLKEGARTYDLLVGATGVNSGAWDLFSKLGFRGGGPGTTRAYITELKLGREAVTQHFGTSMHMFLLNVPRLECAAMIPKGDYLTVCLLGKDIDRQLVDAFFASSAVRRCLPNGWASGQGACHCSPKINVGEAAYPFMDRVVLVGDCGATRLYKDGIGAAYRTAKAAARTAVFSGVSARDFQRHYWPVYRSIARDNFYGRFIFGVVHWIRALEPLLAGTIGMTRREQAGPGAARRMSGVLWDMFTGSARYQEVLLRTLDPRFIGRFAWESVLALGQSRRGTEGGDDRG